MNEFHGAIIMLLSLIMTAALSLYISAKLLDVTNINITITVEQKSGKL